MEKFDLDSYKTETHAEDINTIYDKEIEDIDDVVWENKDLAFEIKSYFRLIRKKCFSFIRETVKKTLPI